MNTLEKHIMLLIDKAMLPLTPNTFVDLYRNILHKLLNVESIKIYEALDSLENEEFVIVKKYKVMLTEKGYKKILEIKKSK